MLSILRLTFCSHTLGKYITSFSAKCLSRFFQAKTIPSNLWSCVLSRPKFQLCVWINSWKNPHSKVQMRFESKLPVRGVTFKMGMQVPHNSFSSVRLDCEIFLTPDNLRKYCPELNALQEHNPFKFFDLTDKQNTLNIRNEQQRDQNIVTVQWLATGPPSSSHYLNSELMKYLKLFDRLEKHNGNLYRKFYNQTGRIEIRQYVVPQHMRNEILYRVHNSKYAGHCGIAKTATLFRQYCYFHNFVELLTDYIKNCSSCLQVKLVKHATLKPQLFSLAIDQCFPGDLLQIDPVDKLPESAGFSFILTAKDFPNTCSLLRCVTPAHQT